MTTINDAELSRYVLKIIQSAKALEELERDGKGTALWWKLEAIAMAAQLAQYRLMELK